MLDLGGGDSFMKSMSGGGRGRADVSIGATWTPKRGLKLTGSAAIEVAIPAHARIGPATIETIYVVSGFKDGKIPLELSASVRGELGPFKASVDRIGIELLATFPAGRRQPRPAATRHALQAAERHRPQHLAAAASTAAASSTSITTRASMPARLSCSSRSSSTSRPSASSTRRLPDGSDGFSLLVIITAEFAPIQLGFGFTLIGVGGLLGLNRTVLYDPLRLGVRDGSLNSILFPKRRRRQRAAHHQRSQAHLPAAQRAAS